MAKADTPQRSTDPAHDDGADNDDNPPAWWEKPQDGVGVSSSRGWRRRLVDTLWSAGPVWCCWTSLAAFVVLNLAVLVCEGPRYLYSSGLLFVAVAIPFPVLGIRWWRKSGCRARV